MQAEKTPLPAREMHKIVWILIGIFTLISVTFPTALFRVSQMEKFRGFHVKSLTVEGELPNSSAQSAQQNIKPVAVENQETIQPIAVSLVQQEEVVSIPEITDSVQLAALNQKLYDQIDQSWQEEITHNLVYEVRVNKDGAIAAYDPLNQPARDYLQATPLPRLLQSDMVSASPQAKFTVIFTSSGILEVSP